MNAGHDYPKARAQAQANADWSGRPWMMHIYGGVWWIERFDWVNGEHPQMMYEDLIVIQPTKKGE